MNTLQALQKLSAKNPNLSLKQFMDVTHCNIDELYISKFMKNIEDNSPIFIDDQIIRWLGYKGLISNCRKHLKRTLKEYNIFYKQKEYNQLDISFLRNTYSFIITRKTTEIILRHISLW